MERSSIGAFFRSFGGGAFNSALMLGLFGLVSGTAAALHLIAIPPAGLLAAFLPLPLATMGIMIAAIGLFNGIMGVWRNHEESNNAKVIARDILRDSEIHSASLAVAPSLSQQAELAEPAQAAERSGNWTERAGRSGGGDRLQAILNNGAMSAKDRASAILAERENGAAASRG